LTPEAQVDALAGSTRTVAIGNASRTIEPAFARAWFRAVREARPLFDAITQYFKEDSGAEETVQEKETGRTIEFDVAGFLDFVVGHGDELFTVLHILTGIEEQELDTLKPDQFVALVLATVELNSAFFFDQVLKQIQRFNLRLASIVGTSPTPAGPTSSTPLPNTSTRTL